MLGVWGGCMLTPRFCISPLQLRRASQSSRAYNQRFSHWSASAVSACAFLLPRLTVDSCLSASCPFGWSLQRLSTTYRPVTPQLQWSGCTQPTDLWRYSCSEVRTTYRPMTPQLHVHNLYACDATAEVVLLLSTTHDAGVVLQYQTFPCSGSAHFWRSLDEHQRAQESPHVLRHVGQTFPQIFLLFLFSIFLKQFQHESEWQVMALFRGLVSLTGLSNLP